MVEAFIGLGSNLGDREGNLKKALEYIHQHPEIEINKVSSFIETEPVGGPPQGNYLNATAQLTTTLSPEELLEFLQEVEKKLGRTRTVRFAPRTIDLDILLYEDKEIDTPTLKIPHPRMWKREFVIKPLLEIAPYLEAKFDKLKRKD